LTRFGKTFGTPVSPPLPSNGVQDLLFSRHGGQQCLPERVVCIFFLLFFSPSAKTFLKLYVGFNPPLAQAVPQCATESIALVRTLFLQGQARCFFVRSSQLVLFQMPERNGRPLGATWRMSSYHALSCSFFFVRT